MAPAKEYVWARVSPDGQRGVTIGRNEDESAWVVHLERGLLSRLTNEALPQTVEHVARCSERGAV